MSDAAPMESSVVYSAMSKWLLDVNSITMDPKKEEEDLHRRKPPSSFGPDISVEINKKYTIRFGI